MGLPFKFKLLGKLLGVDMSGLANFWSWLDGKKTYFGLLLTALGGLATFVPQVALAVPQAKWVLASAGVIQFLNGLLHKAYKEKYNEEHL